MRAISTSYLCSKQHNTDTTNEKSFLGFFERTFSTLSSTMIVKFKLWLNFLMPKRLAMWKLFDIFVWCIEGIMQWVYSTFTNGFNNLEKGELVLMMWREVADHLTQSTTTPFSNIHIQMLTKYAYVTRTEERD